MSYKMQFAEFREFSVGIHGIPTTTVCLSKLLLLGLQNQKDRSN
jgi:hypothetical protein